MLQELLTTAENNSHIIQVTIDTEATVYMDAPFDMRIVGDQCIAFVEAPTRMDAINSSRVDDIRFLLSILTKGIHSRV